ncbi:MAG: NAD(P)H-dependent oxidoreductase [Parvularculaceae bacterium]
MKTLAILGSSRPDGETARLLRAVLAHIPGAEVHDLARLVIGPYSYDYAYADDDFLPLARKMPAADAIIFASPVYWYSMSAQMKAFFDRLTDLTDPPHKHIGKSLAGRTMFLVATGGDASPPASFEPPFADTAGYFNMRWGGMLYRKGAGVLSAQDEAAAKEFAARIRQVSPA